MVRHCGFVTGRGLAAALALAAPFLAGPATAQTSGTVVIPPPPAGSTGYGATLLNHDGSIVVGGASYPTITYTPPPPFSPSTETPNRPWRWTGGATSTDLGAFNGHVFNGAADMSHDGTVVVGTSRSPYTSGFGWIWREGSGYQAIPLPSGSAVFGQTIGGITVNGVSGDGQVVVGGTTTNISRAFRWTAAGGYENIGLPGGTTAAGGPWTSSTAMAASYDGSAVAVTVSGSPLSTTQRAALWTQAGGFQIIEPTTGYTRTRAHGISSDGTIVGGDLLGPGGAQEAFRWSAVGGIQPLGYVPNGQWSFFTGMSGDGDRIVGNSGRDGADAFQTPFLWTEAEGMRTLADVVATAGVDLGGLTLTRANTISADGNAIAGNARNASNQTVPFVLLLNWSAAPILTESFSTTINRTSISLSQVNQSYATTVVGSLDGSQVFTRTTQEAINGAASQAALQDARVAMQAAAGLRRVTFEAPVRTASEQVVLGTTTTSQDVVTGQSQTSFTYTTTGPTVVYAGDRGVCTTPGTAAAGPSGCSQTGTAVIIASGSESQHTHTNTILDVTTTTTTATDQRLDETWEVRGRLGNQIGTVHALAGLAGVDQADRFVWRMLDERGARAVPSAAEMADRASPIVPAPASPWRFIGEAFGRRDFIGADPGRGIARIDGDLAGLMGGIGYQASPGLLVGGAVHWGLSTLRVQDDVAPERLNVDLTQIGGFARLREGAWSLGFSLAYGAGHARTSVGGAPASRSLETLTAGARLGYDIAVAGVTVTPEAGLRYAGARLGAFAEAGGLNPLIGGAATVDTVRGWLGLALAAPFVSGGIAVEPRLSVRLTHDWGEASGRADVAFAALPTVPLVALGPGVGRFGVELGAGAEARLSRSISVFAAYDGRFRERAQSHSATGGVRIVW